MKTIWKIGCIRVVILEKALHGLQASHSIAILVRRIIRDKFLEKKCLLTIDSTYKKIVQVRFKDV